MSQPTKSNELRPEVEDKKYSTGLDSRWFSEDKTKVEKDKTEQVLRNSTIQFRLLKKILKKEFDAKWQDRNDHSVANYKDFQEYNDGYMDCLQDIYRILP